MRISDPVGYYARLVQLEAQIAACLEPLVAYWHREFPQGLPEAPGVEEMMRRLAQYVEEIHQQDTHDN